MNIKDCGDVDAIVVSTYYLGPTNCRGSRIVAKSLCHRVVLPYMHEFSLDENFRLAAHHLLFKIDSRKFRWPMYHLMGGTSFRCRERVFVPVMKTSEK